MFSLLLIIIYVFITADTNLCFITADTNLCFRLFTSNRSILISFLSFDFFWGSYLFLVLSEYYSTTVLQYYSFDGTQCLYFQESIMAVLEDEGTTFLSNVCNNSPITRCHIPEDLNLKKHRF